MAGRGCLPVLQHTRLLDLQHAPCFLVPCIRGLNGQLLPFLQSVALTPREEQVPGGTLHAVATTTVNGFGKGQNLPPSGEPPSTRR